MDIFANNCGIGSSVATMHMIGINIINNMKQKSSKGKSKMDLPLLDFNTFAVLVLKDP